VSKRVRSGDVARFPFTESEAAAASTALLAALQGSVFEVAPSLILGCVAHFECARFTVPCGVSSALVFVEGAFVEPPTT
jgi:hypothetical protein